SISGALSILLASRQPNFGVGGTSDSLAEGLLSALTLPLANCAGTWLIATGWEPEPQLDDQGRCQNTPVCHAVALAFESAVQDQSCGQLRLMVQGGPIESHRTLRWLDSAAGLCKALAALTPGGPAAYLAWRLAWGATMVLEAREKVVGLAAAA